MSGFDRNFNRSIIILSYMRSGSSFVGEFFNVHPEVFYMFEPLHALGGSCHKNNVTRCLETLRQNLQCHFHDRFDQNLTWNEFMELESDFAEENKLDLKGNFVFRHKSKRLCRYPFCAHDFSNDTLACSSHCKPVKIERASKVCKKHVPTAKIIRMHDIKFLKQYENKLEFKAIFLVRDPRAVLASRIEIFKSESYIRRGKAKESDVLVQNLKGVCEFIAQNYHAIFADPFLAERVKIVRYEDVAR